MAIYCTLYTVWWWCALLFPQNLSNEYLYISQKSKLLQVSNWTRPILYLTWRLQIFVSSHSFFEQYTGPTFCLTSCRKLQRQKHASSPYCRVLAQFKHCVFLSWIFNSHSLHEEAKPHSSCYVNWTTSETSLIKTTCCQPADPSTLAEQRGLERYQHPL